MKAIAEGPSRRLETSSSTSASLTAILVRVFFTMRNRAVWPRPRRSSLSAATESPRYSVSTAPLDSRNSSVSSATASALSGLAMGLLPTLSSPRTTAGMLHPGGADVSALRPTDLAVVRPRGAFGPWAPASGDHRMPADDNTGCLPRTRRDRRQHEKSPGRQAHGARPRLEGYTSASGTGKL